jgi:protein-S-isoprenylcysteine O-methyltransferase Ste14
MNRNSGIDLASFGIVAVVVGAILRFAVTVHTSGFNIHKVGDILIFAGIVLVLLSILVIVMGARSRSTTRTEVRETPSGQQRTEQRNDWGTP